MKKEIVIVVAVIIMLSVLAVLPVMSSDENATDVSGTTDGIKAKFILEKTKGDLISGAIVSQTNVSELELPVDIAATDDSVCKIAFNSDRDGDEEIYIMNADGTNVKKLTSNTVPDMHPSWSPDCKKIAFDLVMDGDWEIYVMNANGTSVKKLTNNSAHDRSPDWSPDGSKIAFVSDRDGDWEIYVMNADGTNVKKLTSNTALDTYPDWSPDGSQITFLSDRDGDNEIYVMNADGANVKKLTSNSADDCDPAWSPDGSQIAFDSNRDGDWEIYVMNADGTSVKKLTSDSAVDWVSAWSPDGSKIAFDSDRDGDLEIYVMNADGTNVKKLTSNTADDWMADWCCPNGGKATVSIESASAPHGSTVTVPIRITNVTNLGTANIWLSYNKDVVTVESISEGDLSPITPAIDNAAGVTKMNWFSATGKTGDFVFASVTLKAVGSAGQSSSLDLDVKELGDTSANAISHTAEDGTFTMKMSVFDTGESANPYPSISGTHYGTLTPDQDIPVQKLYTYPCADTGGHTEYVRIYGYDVDESASWEGYAGDWHIITFDSSFTLEAGKTYNYVIKTGSYPQIHHTEALLTDNGWINCTEFVDANGRVYNDWIPAIRLFVGNDWYGDDDGEYILFEDSFENADNWTLEAGWHIEVEDNNSVLSGEDHSWANYNNRNDMWTDFVFETKIKLIYGFAHINYRISDAGRYFIGFEQDGIYIEKEKPWGTFPGPSVSVPAVFNLDQWYTVKIVGNGNNILIFVDDEKYIFYIDDSGEPLVSGTIAFETLEDSHVHFDDIRVYLFDTFGDVCDNCPTIPNPDQADADGYGIGDVYEIFRFSSTLCG